MYLLNVKYLFVIIFSFLLLLTSYKTSFADLDLCNPPKLTPEQAERYVPSKDELVQKYLHIWKRLFREKNKLSEPDFEKHIRVVWANLGGDPVRYFNIHYYVNIDWFYALKSDQLIVYLPSTTDIFRYLNLRRDVYLSEEEIQILSEKAHSPEINTISVIQPLLFSRLDAVFFELNKVAGQTVFGKNKTKLECYMFQDGMPVMTVRAILDLKMDQCVSGYVNLSTGEVRANKSKCRTIIVD